MAERMIVMQPDLASLYRQMLRARLFEKGIARLWKQGQITGEMHLGLGEEGIVAGVVGQLGEGDAMALDHRGTAALLMRGVSPASLLREMLGRSDGLCSGLGGHMHLCAPDQLAASSGIVGSSGPAGAGFALAAQILRPGAAAVCFFGEGAMNQGMLMESLNLASCWGLPLVFVCKDNRLALTTAPERVTGGDLTERARAFGMPAIEVDGSDVTAVFRAAKDALEQARSGKGPSFLRASCVHLEGHFLGDPLLRIVRRPLGQAAQVGWPALRSAMRRRGASLRERADGLFYVASLVLRAWKQSRARDQDPLAVCRKRMIRAGMHPQEVEREVGREIDQAVSDALAPETPVRLVS